MNGTKTYKARWIDAMSLGTIGSVDFKARSDRAAIDEADRIGHEIGLPNSARTIYESGRCVQQRESQHPVAW